MKSYVSQALFICVPCLVVLLVLVALNPRGDYWRSIEPPKAQCEAYNSTRIHELAVLSPSVYDLGKIDRWVREPENTVSNLPYGFVGLAIFLAARRPLSKALGLSCLFLSTGSGFYHASLLPEWRLMDIIGVYAALFCSLAVGTFAVAEIRPKKIHELLLVCVVWIVAFASGIYRNDFRIAGLKLFDSTYVVVVATILGSTLSLLAYKRTTNRPLYFANLSAFALAAPLAFAGNLGDRFGGFWAAPDALIQGHSIWHSFGAITLLCSYEIFASTGFDRSIFSVRTK